MSGSLGVSQAGKAQHAFEHARDRIKEQMNSKEFKRFEEISSLDHVVREAERIGKELETKATSNLENKVSQMAFGIEPYARVVEGFCKLAPMGGDLIWGVVSFLLMSAGTNANVLEEVLDFFTGMAEEIKHLTLVEDTFTGSYIVVSAIEAVYIALIKFWAKAMEYYTDKLKSGEAEQHEGDVKVHLAVIDIVSRIKTWLISSSAMSKEFSKLKGKIAAQKARLHEVEATQHHANEKAERTRRQQEEARRQQKELSDFIAPPDYEHHFRTAKRYRLNGTCDWIRGKREYREWVEVQTSGLLVVYGTAGSGKTILSSWLVNEARSHPAHHITLYHYFKETDDSCNSALAATRSFLHQFYLILLATNDSLLPTLESELQTLKLQPGIHFEALWNITSSLLSRYSERPRSDTSVTITLVVDAMDECQDSRQLVRSLRVLVHDASSKICVAITARQSGQHVDELRLTHPDQALPTILEVTQDDVKEDITALITHSVNQIERLGEPKYQSLRDRIIAVFSDIQNHQGMFLWAYLMCKEVECQLQVSRIWKLLDHLPKGLDGMYARICKRLSANDSSSREFSHHVLQWVVASRRPMTFAELEEALKFMTANGDDSDVMDFFDDDGGLLWSRRDIVRCCGDLVRYTGLAEGDNIAIVHLSARQFLTTHPSKLFRNTLEEDFTAVIQPFLVDTRSAEIKMGILCLKYILSTSPGSNEYFAPPLLRISARTSYQDSFKGRFPLFDYATLYWSEYALNVLQSQSYPNSDRVDLDQLSTTMREFANSEVFAIWLEELIRLTYIEYVQHTLWLFSTLDDTIVSPDDLHWSNLMLKALVDFSRTLKSSPHMVRLCLLHIRSVPVSSRTVSSIRLLEVDGYRRWVRYDPATDNLFSTTSNGPTLNRQKMKTGLRSRPMAVLEVSSKSPLDHFFHFAAISPSASHVATTYSYPAGSYSNYLTTCWNVTTASSFDNWATPVFSDLQTPDRYKLWAHGIAFGKDNSIVTPGGIFSLETNKCIDRPSIIYDPDPKVVITNTWFSGNGEWVARIRDFKTLEVLTIRGVSTYQHDFGGSSRCSLAGFSNTGNKIVVLANAEDRVISCILVKEAKKIDMSISYASYHPNTSHFTRDEGKFAAVFDSRIVVWTFSRDETGSYYDHADMIHISGHLESGFLFDLVPGISEDSVEDALIVRADGSIIRWPLDLEWLPRSDTGTSWVIIWAGLIPELFTWLVKPNVLEVKRWSLGSSQPALISHMELPLHVLSDGREFTASPDGNYLATKTAIIDAHSILNGSRVHELDLPKEIESSAFSADCALFACTYEYAGRWVLHIFEVSQGTLVTRRASRSFSLVEGARGRVNFSGQDFSLLAFDKYVLKSFDNDLVVECQIEEPVQGFSDCGRYFYDEHHRLYELPANLVPETPPPMEPRHLTGTYWFPGKYIYPPHEIQLAELDDVVYFQHRLVNQDGGICSSRVISALPDAMRTSGNNFTLLWPEEDVKNMTLLAVLDQGPILIDTGIRRDELMKEDEWFDDEWLGPHVYL